MKSIINNKKGFVKFIGKLLFYSFIVFGCLFLLGLFLAFIGSYSEYQEQESKEVEEKISLEEIN